MRVEIKQGGDGAACWNAEVIADYAEAVNAREAALVAANRDLIVTPGLIKCYGCQVNDFDLGIRCTAELTRSLYAVAGEVAPRPADAKGSLADITGLRSRVEKSEAAAHAAPVTPSVPVTPSAPPPPVRSGSDGRAAPVPPVPPVAPERRSGLSRLLGRRG